MKWLWLLVPLVLLAGTADAAKRKTFCQKAAKAGHYKVFVKRNGVTVYKDMTLCSDAKRKVESYALDTGYKITDVVAANKRCVMVLATGKGKLPNILFKDLGGKQIGASVTIVGYGNPAGSVGSMSVSKNCVGAWGESVTDAANATTYRVRVKAFGTASDVPSGIVNEIATVAANDDIKHVSVSDAGRKATVRWTLAGAAQSKTLP
jgi:hypothetical protein